MSQDRIQIRIQIQTMDRLGYNVRDIAKELNVDKKTVRLWISRGEGNVKDVQRSGRTSKLSPKTKKKIRKMVENKPGVGTRTVAKKLNFSRNYQTRGKTISRSTVQNYIKSTDWGRHAYVQPVKPLLTEKNIRDRINFCTRLKNVGFCEDTSLGRSRRAQILFTDESLIELNRKPNRQNRRVRTSNPEAIPPCEVPKVGLKIMVAGGISSRGKSVLHIVEENNNVDAEYYISHILPVYNECLNNQIQFPGRRMILMQDGARAHTAKRTLLKIKEIFPEVWEDWPGNSPDLNPIEHVWAKLKDSVLKEPIPRNRDQLVTRVTEEWNSITADEVRNLCESFGRRINECLDNGGHHTSY